MSPVIRSLPVLTLLLCANAAWAQTPQSQSTQPQPPVTTAGQTPDALELTGGFESDSHGASYGFLGLGVVRGIKPGLAWVAQGTASFLSYEFESLDGHTQVRSPGLGATAGLQFGTTHFLRLVAGPEIKWQRTEVTPFSGTSRSDSEVRVGANLGAQLMVNPTPHNNLMGLINYSTADKYTWARVGYKHQVTNLDWQGANTVHVGVDVGAQGNDDIRSTQVGGLVEFTHVPHSLSIQLRAGYKRSTFDVGPSRTGPYVAVGFYKRLN